MKVIGTIQDGEFIPDYKMKKAIVFQKFERQSVSLEIQSVKKRSLPQNRFYWGVVIPLVLERLMDLGTTGEILKMYPIQLDDVGLLNYEDQLTERAVDKFLLAKFHPYTEGMSTRSMNPYQFGGYVMQVILWSRTVLDLKIPEPENTN